MGGYVRREEKGSGGREGRSRGRSGGFGGRSSGRSSGGFSGRSSGRSSGGFRGRSEGRSSSGFGRMHEVTCDKCGKECEVPFKPTGEKPVYCSDCFRKDSSSGPRGSSESRSVSIAPEVTAEDIGQINEKLDKIMKKFNIE